MMTACMRPFGFEIPNGFSGFGQDNPDIQNSKSWWPQEKIAANHLRPTLCYCNPKALAGFVLDICLISGAENPSSIMPA